MPLLQETGRHPLQLAPRAERGMSSAESSGSASTRWYRASSAVSMIVWAMQLLFKPPPPAPCGLEGPQDGRCALLDALARRLDPGDGLLAATGPRCDVPEGVVARVDPERLTDHVRCGLGLQLGQRPVVVALVEEGMSDLVSEGLDPLGRGVSGPRPGCGASRGCSRRWWSRRTRGPRR